MGLIYWSSTDYGNHVDIVGFQVGEKSISYLLNMSLRMIGNDLRDNERLENVR